MIDLGGEVFQGPSKPRIDSCAGERPSGQSRRAPEGYRPRVPQQSVVLRVVALRDRVCGDVVALVARSGPQCGATRRRSLLHVDRLAQSSLSPSAALVRNLRIVVALTFFEESWRLSSRRPHGYSRLAGARALVLATAAPDHARWP